MKTKLKQTLTACALTTALLTSTLPCSAGVLSASDFADVKETDWFYSDLSTLVSRNIISGVSDTEFDHNGTLTLGQVLKMATAVRCIYEKGSNTITPSGTYSHWAEPYGSFANYWGIVNGVPAVEDYDKVVTREEMAEIFANVYPDQTSFSANRINDFSEAPEQDVSDTIKMLYEAGILIGDDTGFRLNESVTRAEAVSIINRVRDTKVRVRLVPEEPVTPAPIDIPKPTQLPDNFKYDADDYAEKVLYYVNIEREKAGVAPLVLDETLCIGAEKRADELIEIGCNSTIFTETKKELGLTDAELCHRRHDHVRSWDTVYSDLGLSIGVSSRGENCASGPNSAESVVRAWMNSEGHRRNILKSSYKKLGVGRAYGTSVRVLGNPAEHVIVTNVDFWVQNFSN